MASNVKLNTGDNPAGGAGGAGAQQPVQLTDEQKKLIEDAFVKAATGIGGPVQAWISGGFSKN